MEAGDDNCKPGSGEISLYTRLVLVSKRKLESRNGSVLVGPIVVIDVKALGLGSGPSFKKRLFVGFGGAFFV